MNVETMEKTPENLEEFERKGIEIKDIENKPLTDEEIDKKIAKFWQAYDAITEADEKTPLSEEIKKLGASRMPEFMNICPDVPVFYSITAEQLDSYPARLKEFNDLWHKFILGEEMAKEERGMLEVFYRGYLKG